MYNEASGFCPGPRERVPAGPHQVVADFVVGEEQVSGGKASEHVRHG